MSRKSFYFSSSNTKADEGIEELQRLDQEITLKLQEIDKEFSTSNKIVAELIMPKILEYQKNSRDIWEAVGFWKGFFENSANVDLLTNKDHPRHQHRYDEENVLPTGESAPYEVNLSSSIHGFTSSDNTRRNSSNQRLTSRDLLETSNVQTNEVIGDETNVNVTDSLFLEDPIQTRKKLTSSTPNTKRSGIKNTSYIGESSSFLPPTLEFFRDKNRTTNGSSNNNSAEKKFRSPVRLSSDDYHHDDFQTAHEFSDFNNSSEYHTLRLEKAKKTSVVPWILEPPNKTIKLNNTEILRSKSPSSIVDNYTPRRKSRRSSTSSNRMGAFASRYDSSPELEPPVLQSDKFFSPTKRGRYGVEEEEEEQIKEREDSLVRRKSLENIDNSGQRLERFPQSPKFGAGGLLYRTNNGRGYVLSFKDASTQEQEYQGQRGASSQTTAIIQNDDSTLDDIVAPELVSHTGGLLQSEGGAGTAISEKYDSDDDVILEEDISADKSKTVEGTSPNPFQESESSKLSSM